MLVYVAVFLLIIYVVLDRTGVIADLAKGFRPRNGHPNDQHPELETKTKLDPDAERRLDVFEEFIERLDPGDKDD